MTRQPNFLFIMSDDHAAHAMSCYGSRINRTPNLDRIAQGGMRFDNCFCTNSICTPSRAAILTGTWNHINGVTTLATPMDNRLPTFVKTLQAQGWQTGIFGKWHLGSGPQHCPSGFDDWAVLPGQGLYHNPTFIFNGPDGGQQRVVPGYVTDIITDMSLDWLNGLDRERPFMLMCHHKAPHRPWEPDEKHAHLFLNEQVPEPDTLQDDYSERAAAAPHRDARRRAHATAISRQKSPTSCPRPSCAAGPTSATSRTTCASSTASTTTSAACWTGSTSRAWRKTPSSSTPPTRASFWATTAGTTNASCTRSRCACPCLCDPRAIEAGSRNADMVLNVDFAPTFLELAGIEPTRPCRAAASAPCCRAQRRGTGARRCTIATGCTRRSTTSTPLRHPHPAPQAHLLLRRRARTGRQHR